MDVAKTCMHTFLPMCSDCVKLHTIRFSFQVKSKYLHIFKPLYFQVCDIAFAHCCRGKYGLAMSCSAKLIYSTLFFTPSDSLSQASSVFHQLQGAKQPPWGICNEFLTCHSGYWRPINENSATDFLPIRDYGERQEPSLLYLGCSSLRKTAIVTTCLP